MGHGGGRRRGDRSLLFVALLAFALGGCERGCLSRWLSERGVGAESTAPDGAVARAGKRADFGLEGTDCGGGLMRCIDGRVEASIAAHLPHPCSAEKNREAPRAACSCPWEAFARCASGCAVDGLEVVGEPSDAGAAQLCRADAPVARPVLPGDPVPTEVCAERSIACVDGIVRVCEAALRPTQAVAVCLHGCQWQVALDTSSAGLADPGASQSPDGVVSILCRRDHAEHR